MPILTHFLTLQTSRIDPVPSIIHNEKSLETTQFQGFSYGRGRRIRILDSQSEWGIRFVLFAKNDSPNRFLNAQTLRVLILFYF